MEVRLQVPDTLPELGVFVLASLVIMFGTFVLLTVAYVAATKVPGLSIVVQALVTSLLAPIAVWVRDQVYEATRDIRSQVYPNGGSSITDRLDDLADHMRHRFEDVEDYLDETIDKVDRMEVDIGYTEGRAQSAHDGLNNLSYLLLGMPPKDDLEEGEEHAQEVRNRAGDGEE